MDNKNRFAAQVSEWLNERGDEYSESIGKDVSSGAELFTTSSEWLAQLRQAILLNQPENFVKRMIITENTHGDIIKVDYDYFRQNDPAIGNISFRVKTVSKKDPLHKSKRPI